MSITEWTVLCREFEASGNEQFVAFGRFSSFDSLYIQRRTHKEKSVLDINKSAYYLVDEMNLYQVSVNDDCGCKTDLKPPPAYRAYNEEETYVLRNFLFDFDKAEIKPEFLEDLHRLLSYLQSNNSYIFISGHTDKEGSEAYNLKLSMERAKAIADWLKQNGIASERVSYKGFGSSKPLVKEVHNQNNRRVEFYLKRRNE